MAAEIIKEPAIIKYATRDHKQASYSIGKRTEVQHSQKAMLEGLKEIKDFSMIRKSKCRP